jgi:hypothetical protein
MAGPWSHACFLLFRVMLSKFNKATDSGNLNPRFPLAVSCANSGPLPSRSASEQPLLLLGVPCEWPSLRISNSEEETLGEQLHARKSFPFYIQTLQLIADASCQCEGVLLSGVFKFIYHRGFLFLRNHSPPFLKQEIYFSTHMYLISSTAPPLTVSTTQSTWHLQLQQALCQAGH